MVAMPRVSTTALNYGSLVDEERVLLKSSENIIFYKQLHLLSLKQVVLSLKAG